MGAQRTATVRVELIDSPRIRAILLASLDLVVAVEDADPALIPDDVREAARLARAAWRPERPAGGPPA